MKLTNAIHSHGLRLFAVSLTAIGLSSCGALFVKETNSASATSSEVSGTLAESEQEVEEAANSAIAANNLSEPEMEPVEKKKKGIFGKLFGRSKKDKTEAEEKAADAVAEDAGSVVDMTDGGIKKTPGGALATAEGATRKAAGTAEDTSRDVVRSTTDTSRKVTSAAADTGASTMDTAASTASRAGDNTSPTVETTTPTVKAPTRPDIVLPDDETDMIDNVPSITSGGSTATTPKVDDDGFLPLTPSPKLPAEEDILVPGE